MINKLIRFTGILILLLLAASPALAADDRPQINVSTIQAVKSETYTNPLRIQIPNDGLVESCADPTIIHGQATDTYWYMYCTTDPLNGSDKTGDSFNFHLIPMLRSSDLVNWTYMGDAFSAQARLGGRSDAGLWAPEIQYFNGQYYLYYTASSMHRICRVEAAPSAWRPAAARSARGWTAARLPSSRMAQTAAGPICVAGSSIRMW